MLTRNNPKGGRTAAHLLLAVSALGATAALAGCTAPEDRSYRDGEYLAEGSYSAPSGTETIGVDIVLENDTVTAVTVTPHATDGSEAKFQNKFADGIAAEVLGKDIDELTISRVGGSSLTSNGFKEALEAIKSDAGEL